MSGTLVNIKTSQARKFGPAAKPTEEGVAVLSSWKDIARYLGKGVRTAQRWERDSNLPVRRLQKSPKSAVIAVPAEIDAWVKNELIPPRADDFLLLEVAELRKCIKKLRAENRDLLEQLAVERSKNSRVA